MPYYGLYIPVKGSTTTTTSAAAGGAPSPGSAQTNENGITNGGAATNNTNAADIAENSSERPLVFCVKTEALEVLKSHKDARLREFSSEEDAVKYAKTGHEVVQTKYADVKTSTANLEKAIFRGPTKQELVEFRRVIEAGDYERVKTIIWDNPRYLISSGDTPTSLKEGCRYNAMHICAISKKSRIAELILQTVSDPKFVNLLTGKKNDEKMCKELCANLLDYYLNIPEKGRSETPLHLAVKTGGVEMIEVLISYPECKMTPNKDGLFPKDIICSRMSNADPELINKIKLLLNERFFVPVLRSVDSAIPPHIGQPFSNKEPPVFNTDPLSPEVKIHALAGPMNKEQAKQFCHRWKTPPRAGSKSYSPSGNNPFISPMKLHRTLNNSNSSPNSPYGGNNSFGNSPNNSTSIKRRALFDSSPPRSPFTSSADNTLCEANNKDLSFVDKQNGNHNIEKETSGVLLASNEMFHIETNNNNQQQQQQQQPQQQQQQQQAQLNMPIMPFKSQLNKFKSTLRQTSSPFMMKKQQFFNYREQNAPSTPSMFDDLNSATDSRIHFLFDSPAFKERHIKITDTEKGLEIIGRELAKRENVEWREYWDFLDVFIDITSSEGLQKLESYFMQRIKDADKLANGTSNSALTDDVCNAFVSLNINSNEVVANTTQTSTPYTYVEKSLQVFAKRMTKNIIHNIDNMGTLNDTFFAELKRLRNLVCSFKEDERFQHFNFHKVHSRIGNLVSIYLCRSQEFTVSVNKKIEKMLHNIIVSPGELREHMECVCSKILLRLDQRNGQTLPEDLKTEDMCAKVWLREMECKCQWDGRKTNRSIRMEARSRYHQAKQQEQHQKADVKQTKSQQSVTDVADKLCNAKLTDDMYEDSDSEVYWYCCHKVHLHSGSDDSDEEMFYTPPQSPSAFNSTTSDEVAEEENKIMFIYGNEPTKRDLDVLNAIFHLNIDKLKYPNICAWKEALLSFSTEEMDYFPAPYVIKKSHVLRGINSVKTTPLDTPQQQKNQPPSPQLPKKINRILATPPKLESVKRVNLPNFVTPINKIKGLYSAYREQLENTPLSASFSSSTRVYNEFSNELENNLSLFQISHSEDE